MIVSRKADVAGVAVRYRETGEPDAPVVVLLHGGGSDARTWDGFAASLAAAGRRVVAAGLLGARRKLRVPDPVWWQRLSLITAPTLVISGGAGSHLSPQRFGEVVLPFLTRG